MIPLTRPWIGDAEIEAAARVLRSGMLVQGPEVAAFEAEVARATGRAHGVAVSNGTSALVLALRVLGVGPGDDVLCPALTWPSPAHAILEVGATPVLVDVDPGTWNVRAAALQDARTPKTAAAIVIDQFGVPLEAAVGELDLPVIEDAACAIGATLADGRPCGTLGALSTVSFHPRKLLTTGEGGVVVTDDAEHAATLRALRNHGQRGPGEFVRASGNHRLTDLQAAIGRAQMQRLDEAIARRQRCAARIREGLSGRLTFQQAPEGARPNAQTLGALVPEPAMRAELLTGTREAGVQVGLLSYALSEVPTVGGAACPVAESIVARGIALPLYPQMQDDEVTRVVDVLGEALKALA